MSGSGRKSGGRVFWCSCRLNPDFRRPLPGYSTRKYSRVSIHHESHHEFVMPDKDVACSLPSTASSWIPGSLSWQKEARSLAPCIAPQHTLHTIHAVSGCPAEVQLHVEKDCASMVFQWPHNEIYQVNSGYTACISTFLFSEDIALACGGSCTDSQHDTFARNARAGRHVTYIPCIMGLALLSSLPLSCTCHESMAGQSAASSSMGKDALTHNLMCCSTCIHPAQLKLSTSFRFVQNLTDSQILFEVRLVGPAIVTGVATHVEADTYLISFAAER